MFAYFIVSLSGGLAIADDAVEFVGGQRLFLRTDHDVFVFVGRVRMRKSRFAAVDPFLGFWRGRFSPHDLYLALSARGQVVEATTAPATVVVQAAKTLRFQSLPNIGKYLDLFHNQPFRDLLVDLLDTDNIKPLNTSRAIAA